VVRVVAGTLGDVVSAVLCLRMRCAMRVWWGAVAQLGERLVRNEEVSGSIPLSSTIETKYLASKSGSNKKWISAWVQ
jgi:hypothetical protein